MATIHYIWDTVSDNYLMETDENGNVISEYLTEPDLHGEMRSQRQGDNCYYYHYNGLQDVVSVTNDIQDIVESVTYSAFGGIIHKTSSLVNHFSYKGGLGYYTTQQTNDISVRQRVLYQDTGRWLSLDPIGFLDGPNRYSYVRNRPICFSDAYGIACQPATKKGANYVGGRGTFGAGYPHEIDATQHPELYEPNIVQPMILTAEWIPAPPAFLDQKTGCCCCDQIGWVQIVKASLDYGGLASHLPEYYSTHDWIVDRRWISTNRFQYPGDSSGATTPKTTNPCAIPPSPIGFFDWPSVSEKSSPIPWLYHLRTWTFTAEACVYCMGGIEGPGNSFSTSTAMNLVWLYDHLVVYDCVKWGFSVKVENGKTQVARDKTTTGLPSAEAWEKALTTELHGRY